MEKTCLYLDDIRTPLESPKNYKNWVIVRNYDEFVNYITNHGIPDLISLDHDLADEHMIDFNNYQAKGIIAVNYQDFKEKTGLDCAKFLCDYCDKTGEKIKIVTVHSHNPAGRENIISYIKGYIKHYDVKNAYVYAQQHPFKV